MKKSTGSLLFDQPGNWRFYFDKFGESIEVNKPKISVNNVILGKMYFDIENSYPISGLNLKTGDKFHMKFTPKSWSAPSKLEGTCSDPSGKVIYEISGSWCDKVFLKNKVSGSEQCIWQIEAPIEN